MGEPWESIENDREQQQSLTKAQLLFLLIPGLLFPWNSQYAREERSCRRVVRLLKKKNYEIFKRISSFIQLNNNSAFATTGPLFCVQIHGELFNIYTVKRLIPATFLIALLVLFSWMAPRLQGLLPGFSPLPPLFFCIAACMSTRWIWLPATAWTLSYFIVNITQGYSYGPHFYVIIAGLAASFWVGTHMRHRPWFLLIGGSLGAALAFYIVTNTGTWFLSAQYAKTWAGWVQCQTYGLPGYPPAWMFLKGQLAASALFTPLFLLGQGYFGGAELGIRKQATVPGAY